MAVLDRIEADLIHTLHFNMIRFSKVECMFYKLEKFHSLRKIVIGPTDMSHLKQVYF